MRDGSPPSPLEAPLAGDSPAHHPQTIAAKPNAHPGQFHLGYRPALDGIRGISILFVLFVHNGLIRDSFGFLGINTFFVLSGFLITSLLVAEWDQTGSIRFRNFYFRRALRLLPALITMLVVFLIYVFLFDPHKRAMRELYEALRALFYCTNIARVLRIGKSDMLANTWSLSLEEQFYFLWPPILFWLLRKTDRKSLLSWIALGIFLSVLTRISLFLCGTDQIAGNVYPASPERLLGCLDTRADSLLVGCFAGVLMSTNLRPGDKLAIPLTLLAGLASIGLLLCATHSFLEGRMICFGLTIASIFAAILIVQQVTTARTPLHWILENPVLVYIGKISYGIYLWNYPLLHRPFIPTNLGYPWQNLVNLIPVVIAVLACYYLVERPCLKLKRTFQIVC